MEWGRSGDWAGSDGVYIMAKPYILCRFAKGFFSTHKNNGTVVAHSTAKTSEVQGRWTRAVWRTTAVNQSIDRSVSVICIVTRCKNFQIECTKFCSAGAPPQTPLGSLQRSPDPLLLRRGWLPSPKNPLSTLRASTLVVQFWNFL